MIPILLDLVGSYFLSRITSRRVLLIALAVLLGLANGFVGSALTLLIMGQFATDTMMLSVMRSAVLLHPLICLIATLWLRHRLERRTGA